MRIYVRDGNSLFDVNFSFNMSKNVLCYYGKIILMATCGQLV